MLYEKRKDYAVKRSSAFDVANIKGGGFLRSARADSQNRNRSRMLLAIAQAIWYNKDLAQEEVGTLPLVDVEECLPRNSYRATDIDQNDCDIK